MYRRQRSRGTRRTGKGLKKAENRRQQINSHLFIQTKDNPVNQAAFWSQDTFSLEEIISNYPLPRIIRCVSELISEDDHSLPVNIHLPMLLCPGRSAVKLLAKHVGYAPKGHRLVETDDTIVIPADYEGNFLRLQAQTSQDVTKQKTLDQIAESSAPAFLSLSPIVVFYQTQVASNISVTGNNKMTNDISDSGNSSVNTNELSRLSKTSTTSIIQRRMVQPPGSVFLILGATKGMASTKKKRKEVTILKCSDPKGNPVLISTDQPGEFVEVVPPSDGSDKLSMRSSELMATNRYPSLVRYVYGKNAPRLQPCSYMFTLVDTFREESVIGCLLYPKRAFMIELPVMSSLRFQVALNTEDLMNLDLPLEAREVVYNRRESYMKDLKLKCKFLHRVGQNDGIDGRDDLMSATVRTRMYANESFFYL